MNNSPRRYPSRQAIIDKLSSNERTDFFFFSCGLDLSYLHDQHDKGQSSSRPGCPISRALPRAQLQTSLVAFPRFYCFMLHFRGGEGVQMLFLYYLSFINLRFFCLCHSIHGASLWCASAKSLRHTYRTPAYVHLLFFQVHSSSTD